MHQTPAAGRRVWPKVSNLTTQGPSHMMQQRSNTLKPCSQVTRLGLLLDTDLVMAPVMVRHHVRAALTVRMDHGLNAAWITAARAGQRAALPPTPFIHRYDQRAVYHSQRMGHLSVCRQAMRPVEEPTLSPADPSEVGQIHTRQVAQNRNGVNASKRGHKDVDRVDWGRRQRRVG